MSAQPALAWQFESSNVDSVNGLAPSSSLQPGPGYLQGTAALVTNAPTSNTAVLFDGTTGCYMTLGASGPTTFNTNSSNLFVEAWVRAISTANPTRIYGRGASISSTVSYDFTFRFNAGSLGVANGTTTVSAPGTVTSGVWYHCALSITTTGLTTVFLNGLAGTPTVITMPYRSTYDTYIGAMTNQYTNGYIRDLRVVQGGIVPTTNFTPEEAPFSYNNLPNCVTGSGSTVFTLLSQFFPLYVPGEYNQAINFNNTLAAAGQPPNCYVTYDVSSYNLTANSTTMSLWLNPGLTYPVTAGTNPFYINLQGASYNGLYTASATSTISFRKGTSPPTTIGSVTAQTGVWQHHCMVFSNVGAVGTSNTFSSYYVNGSFIATANNTIQGFTTLNLGCQNTGTNGALCSIDDLRLFNTALTAAQVQTIYAAQGMPNQMSLSGSGTTSMTGSGTISLN